MDKVDQLLQILEESNFSSYEQEEFSNFTPAQQKKLIALRASQPPNRNLGISRSDTLKMGRISGNPETIKAQLDVKVKLFSEATAMVAGTAYEFAIFGANDVTTGYNSLITDAVTKAGTVKQSVLGAAGAFTSEIFDSLQFKFTGTTGRIVISADVVDYPALLQALITDMFHVSRIRVSLGDTSTTGSLASLSEKIKIIKKSLFGKREEDVISMNAYKMPEQNQAGIIDIPASFWVDANTTILAKICAVSTTVSVLQQTMTFSFFIDQYYKHGPQTV